MVDGKQQSGWSIFKRVLAEQRTQKRSMAGIACLSLAAAPLLLLPPLAMKIALDSYIGEEPLPGFIRAVVPESVQQADMGPLFVALSLLLLAAMLGQVLKFTKGVLEIYTREKLVLGFRARLFPHLERLSLSYHDEKGASESTFRVLMDTAVIPGILLDGMLPLIQAAVVVLAMSIVILFLNYQLALVALAIAPVLLLISWPFGKSLRKQWHVIKELDSSAMGLLQEAFAAVRVIKTFGREERETQRLMDLGSKSMHAKVKVSVTQGKFDAWIAILTALGTAAFLLLGAVQVKAGVLTLGELVLIAALMAQLYSPLQLMVGQIAGMQSALASAERALELLDLAPDVQELPNARSIHRAKGAIEFQAVSFAYDADKPVLHDVSFDVPQGMRVGIAGATGAGKTTLMSLLLRLYDAGQGTVLLDGIDIKEYRVADLRRQFSVVLQEPVLFKKSIAENIDYGLSGSTREATINAAKLANAHDFIMAQPDGYDTIVGERGMRLSGGERQRIALARAYLKDAPILILDEPTSSVDMRTEAQILDALERLMSGRTTFIIAHRPSTLESCDKVLVLEQGRVVAFAAPDAARSLDELMLTRAVPAKPAGKREASG